MNILQKGLLSFCSVLILSSCNKEDAISYGHNYIATVVKNQATEIVLEVDGARHFYASPAITSSNEKVEEGDRLFLRYLAVNFDQQVEGADGTLANPYTLSDVYFEKMITYQPIPMEEVDQTIEGNQLTYFQAPSLKKTVKGDIFLNLVFEMPYHDCQQYYLNEVKNQNDTIQYNFVTKFVNDNLEKETTHVETFKLSGAEDAKIIMLNFNAKNYNRHSSTFFNSRTCILPMK